MFMNKSYYFITVLLILYFSPFRYCTAEERTIKLSLHESIDRVLKENLNFKSSYFGIRAGELSIIQAESKFDPAISINITRDESATPTYLDYYKVNKIDSKSTRLNFTFGQNLSTGANWGLGLYNSLSESNIETERNYSTNLAFQINQPLLKGYGKKISRSNIYLARLTRESTIYDIESRAAVLVYDVQNAYWNLVYELESMKVRQLSMSQADSLLAYNRKGFELGILIESDVLEAESELLSRKHDVLDQLNRIHASEDVLRRLLNLTSEEAWRLKIIPTDNPPVPGMDIDTEGIEAIALEMRPEFKIMRKQLEQDKLWLYMAKNSLSPNLDLTARYRIDGSDVTYSKNLRDLSDVGEYGWTLGLLYSYPLKNRDAKADYEKRQIAIKRVDLSLEDLKSQIITEIRSGIRNVENLRERVEVARLSVKVNGLKLNKEEERFRNQLSTSYFVLQFQTDFANARNLYNKALTDYTMAVVGLQKARGTLLRDLHISIIAEDN